MSETQSNDTYLGKESREYKALRDVERAEEVIRKLYPKKADLYIAIAIVACDYGKADLLQAITTLDFICNKNGIVEDESRLSILGLIALKLAWCKALNE